MSSKYEQIAHKWLTEAKQFEKSAEDCYERGDDDEGDMNHVEAETLRRCAHELASLTDTQPQPTPVPERDENSWPNGCQDANSCANHMACMYKLCQHEFRDISDDVKAALAMTRPHGGGDK
ncbi:hypothetical protein ACWAT4_21775 [Bradyrhizobium manausense]